MPIYHSDVHARLCVRDVLVLRIYISPEPDIDTLSLRAKFSLAMPVYFCSKARAYLDCQDLAGNAAEPALGRPEGAAQLLHQLCRPPTHHLHHPGSVSTSV